MATYFGCTFSANLKALQLVEKQSTCPHAIKFWFFFSTTANILRSYMVAALSIVVVVDAVGIYFFLQLHLSSVKIFVLGSFARRCLSPIRFDISLILSSSRASLSRRVVSRRVRGVYLPTYIVGTRFSKSLADIRCRLMDHFCRFIRKHSQVLETW